MMRRTGVIKAVMFRFVSLWMIALGFLHAFHLCHCSLPTPTPSQYRYQSTDFVALIHFNMGTFAHNGDPCCDKSNWNVKASYASGKTSDPSTFNPRLLNTDQWMESITALGANIAILTAKHGCGFCLWPTKAKFFDSSSYDYSVGVGRAAIQQDVLREFVNSAEKFGVGHGFYYSIMKNFFLCRSFSGGNSCMKEVLKNQRNVSDVEYHSIALQHVTELWTEYGNLTEIWVDSGLGGFANLMVKLQPQAAGTPLNPLTWCGTESGHPSRDVGGGPVWNTGNGFHGNLSENIWSPKFCDPQLFQEHVWFWEPNLHVRTLEMLIPIYHDIVGRGMVMELAFSIDRDGLVEGSHAKMYKEFGDWVRECYGTPLASTSGVGSHYALSLDVGDAFDRFQIMEDISMGERVRDFEIRLERNGDTSGIIFHGQSIGRKRIVVLHETQRIEEETVLHLVVNNQIAITHISQFAVFKPCRRSSHQDFWANVEELYELEEYIDDGFNILF